MLLSDERYMKKGMIVSMFLLELKAPNVPLTLRKQDLLLNRSRIETNGTLRGRNPRELGLRREYIIAKARSGAWAGVTVVQICQRTVRPWTEKASQDMRHSLTNIQIGT